MYTQRDRCTHSGTDAHMVVPCTLSLTRAGSGDVGRRTGSADGQARLTGAGSGGRLRGQGQGQA